MGPCNHSGRSKVLAFQREQCLFFLCYDGDMSPLKSTLKKIIPRSVFDLYYRTIAWLAAVRYRRPSHQLIVIGITGTKGKSTTANMLWHILTQAGHTVGITGTVNYRIGEYEELTTNKMTMAGRFGLQRWLRRMVDAGCDIAIVETTSEGIKQFRHTQIWYDVVGLTNLTPEHIESHGGFENYKQAKLELFRHLARSAPKQLTGKIIPQVSVVTMGEHAPDFLAIGDFEKLTIGQTNDCTIQIGDIRETLQDTDFLINNTRTHIPLLGGWNAWNAALAVGIAQAVGVETLHATSLLQTVPHVPGRMEFIDAGQPFTVIVDYAYEPVSLELLYRFCRTHASATARLITLISSTGGGRDVARRPKNGALAARLCDLVIVTDEDPYDDDPQQIIDQVAAGAIAAGAVEGQNLWKILDRRSAIRQACRLAQPGDVVLLTAKGAEQRMCVAGGKKIAWDDREVVRQVLSPPTP